MELYLAYVGVILGLYWRYIRIILGVDWITLGLYWCYIGVMLWLYWGFLGVILGNLACRDLVDARLQLYGTDLRFQVDIRAT